MKTLLVKCPSVQWQPDGLTIHAKQVVPRSQIPRSTSHLSYEVAADAGAAEVPGAAVAGEAQHRFGSTCTCQKFSQSSNCTCDEYRFRPAAAFSQHRLLVASGLEGAAPRPLLPLPRLSGVHAPRLPREVHRLNRNPRPQPKKWSKLVFLILSS